jgi:hypothetical protein
MIQRMNCVQNQIKSNQIISHDTSFLIRESCCFHSYWRPGQRPAHSRRTRDILVSARFVFGKFPFVGRSRGWYAEDTENNFDKMQNSQQIKKI